MQHMNANNAKMTFLLIVCSNGNSPIVFSEEENDHGYGKVSIAPNIVEDMRILGKYIYHKDLPDRFDPKGSREVRVIL
jgi:hypothetical protein